MLREDRHEFTDYNRTYPCRCDSAKAWPRIAYVELIKSEQSDSVFEYDVLLNGPEFIQLFLVCLLLLELNMTSSIWISLCLTRCSGKVLVNIEVYSI